MYDLDLPTVEVGLDEALDGGGQVSGDQVGRFAVVEAAALTVLYAFVVEASDNSAENVFVGEASLDGRPLPTSVLPHEAITGGGVLRLQMTAAPN